MKTTENQKSTNHQPAAQKPFFGAGTEHAFFSAERAVSTPFFQPKAVSPSALQAKSATSEALGISQPVVQLMPAFESEINDNSEVQRSLFNSPQQLSASPIQAKLTIGEPKDKYEQEADRVASQVVEQIHAPTSAQSTQGRSVQRQEEKPEELQAKPEITILQRQQEKPEELQAMSTLQRQEAIAGGEASTDLTSAINSARGGGQPLEADLQQSMGQAMGADFSGVRVHTDAQSDQLNRSIQAKAFTTGQDVFFRQGEYNPGSRGGQELIAHELTHVVQQNGGNINSSLYKKIQRQINDVIQRLDDKNGNEITLERVAAETDLPTLQQWKELAEQDWDTADLADNIGLRIQEIQRAEATAQAAAQRTKQIQAAKLDLENLANQELQNYDYAVHQQITFLNRNQQAEFFKICENDNIDPGTIVANISAASTSDRSRNCGVSAFVEHNVPLARVIQLAAKLESLLGLRMNTIKSAEINTMVNAGVLKVVKETYCDTPMKSGSVYVFCIVHTQSQLLPEWHVHWGPQNRIEAASWKNNRMAVGQGARVSTVTEDNKTLKQCIGGLWGP